jgi:ribA/ribD-fused uncharacterized protein
MNPNIIRGFHGQYRWLSNFYASPVMYEGLLYPTVEHAFAAAKTLHPVLREQIRTAETPGRAKRLGRKAVLRAGWDEMRVDVMKNLLIEKFGHEPFTSMLLNTGEAYLEEANDWGDKFWGTCEGVGYNTLGWLLMHVRDELNEIRQTAER